MLQMAVGYLPFDQCVDHVKALVSFFLSKGRQSCLHNGTLFVHVVHLWYSEAKFIRAYAFCFHLGLDKNPAVTEY